jgi:dolichol kinase
VYIRAVRPKRRHARVGFAIFAVLAILGLFLLDGIAAGVVLFAAMLVFIGSCISALRGEDSDSVAHNNRTGFAGWFGGWF